MKLGFIGLGNIGAQIALRVASKHPGLSVYDINSDAVERFVGKAHICPNAAEVADSADIIGICVRDEADARAVLFGADGLQPRLRAGTIIAVHSTLSPRAMSEFETQLGQQVRLLDAPVTGGPQAAAEGRICAMVGGEKSALEQIAPYLSAFCSSVIRAGRLGTGMAVKICNNMVYYQQVMAVYEGFKLADSVGAGAALRQVMSDNGNLTPLLHSYLALCGGTSAAANNLLPGTEHARALAEKDLDLALQFASDSGLDLRGAALARTTAVDVYRRT